MTQVFTPEWLSELGDLREDAARVHSLKLFSDSYEQFMRGYHMDAAQMILDGRVAAGAATDQIITVVPIPFCSLCEHHLLPFFGTAEITYTAGEWILGLGKFPRVVEALSTRLHLQENLTAAIAGVLQEYLKPKALSVTLEAQHLCLDMRRGQGAGTLLKTIKKL